MQNCKYMKGIVFTLLFSAYSVSAESNESVNTPPSDITPEIAMPADTTGLDDSKNLTLGRLETIQSETVVVEAQVIRAKAIKSLQESNGYSQSLPGVLPGSLNSSDSAVPVKTKQEAMPLISEIYGAGNKLIAKIVLSDGSYSEVAQNQRIPGTRYVVKRITANEVIVSSGLGGEEFSLAFNQ